MTKKINRDDLSLAGVQYGHQTKRWNPKMAPFIFTTKNKKHILNLEKTIIQLNEAGKVLEKIGEKGGKLLFVGTKKTAMNAVKEAALRSGNYFVNQRWLGGTLTNLKTILIRIKSLWEIEQEEKNGKLALRTKKEQIKILKEKAKLEKTLGGIKQMHKLPAALVVVDPKTDEIAVKEARKLHIPVIAICDTNADPDLVDYVIPGNDDIQESVNLLVNILVDFYAKGAELNMAPSILKTVSQKKEINFKNTNNNTQSDFRENNTDSKKEVEKNNSTNTETDKSEK